MRAQHSLQGSTHHRCLSHVGHTSFSKAWGVLLPEMHIFLTFSERQYAILPLNVLCCLFADILYEELFHSDYSLGILPTSLQCVNSLLNIIFLLHWYIGWLVPAVHDSDKNVITVYALVPSTRSLYKFRSLSPAHSLSVLVSRQRNLIETFRDAQGQELWYV